MAAAASVLGLVLVASPVANADALDDQNATITGDRGKYGARCSPLKFNPTLQSMAQDAVASFAGGTGGVFGRSAGAPNASRYNGEIRSFDGYGDPQAAALTNAYERGAGPMLSNCEFTEFGSGFKRDEDAEEDAVMIIFGKLAAVAAPAPPIDVPKDPVVVPPPAQPVNCPVGAKTDTVVPPAQCEPPSNAAVLSVTKEGINANVTVTNKSKLPADCSYTATRTAGFLGPATVNRDLSVGPNSSESITDMLFPVATTSYRATVTCTATYDGGQITIGESTQNVDGG